MREEYLTKALDLQGLYVESMTMEADRIDLRLERDDGGCTVCSRCGQYHFAYHDRHEIHPQDLKISGRNVRLHLWRH